MSRPKPSNPQQKQHFEKSRVSGPPHMQLNSSCSQKVFTNIEDNLRNKDSTPPYVTMHTHVVDIEPKLNKPAAAAANPNPSSSTSSFFLSKPPNQRP